MIEKDILEFKIGMALIMLLLIRLVLTADNSISTIIPSLFFTAFVMYIIITNTLKWLDEKKGN